jgi:drug/metabolite transporter (DMT)-like permease
MYWLFLYVFCALHFSQLLRLGQKRSCRTMSVVGVNYILAGALSLAAMLVLGGWEAGGRTRLAALGAASGVLFVLHALVMLAAFRIVGTGITWAFVGSGVVIPVLIARFRWGEDMSVTQWVALGLVPLAVALMRPPKREGEAEKRAGLKGDLILVLCLLMAGAIGTLHKAQEIYVKTLPAVEEASRLISRERLFYQAVLFGTTVVMSVGFMAAAGLLPTGKETAIGLGVGLANTCGLFFALLAINAVAATVFFPSSGCLVIVGNTVAGRVLWKERPVPRQWAGLAVALAIVVLANLRA